MSKSRNAQPLSHLPCGVKESSQLSGVLKWRLNLGGGGVGHALHHQHLLLIRERTKLGDVLPDAAAAAWEPACGCMGTHSKQFSGYQD